MANRWRKIGKVIGNIAISLFYVYCITAISLVMFSILLSVLPVKNSATIVVFALVGSVAFAWDTREKDLLGGFRHPNVKED